MFCKKCGEVLQEDSVFCPMCGTNQKVISENAQSSNRNTTDSILVHTAEKLATEVLQSNEQQVKKALQKKTKEITHKVLVRTGLEHENLLDKVKKIQKKIKKR